jgi:putative PIN family toxin of toxin-antitoxin system
MKLKIVLDTNIFISAVLGPKGASRQIIRGCLQQEYLPLMGNTLFLEYEALLSRRKLFANCILSPQEREVLLDAYLSVCRWVTVYYAWRPNLRDENDNHLIELAVAGGADYLITKNTRDFTGANLQFRGLKVQSPQRFLEEVQGCQP